MKKIVLAIIFLLIISQNTVKSIEAINDVEFDIDQNDTVPIKFWRADPQLYPIIETKIFPMVTLSSSSSLANLGKAWVTWNLNRSNQELGVFALYNKGKITNFQAMDTTFENIIWKGLGSQLIMIGSTNLITELRIYSVDGLLFSQEIQEPLKNIEVYVGDQNIFAYGENKNTNQSVYYFQQGASLIRKSTNDTMLIAKPSMAIIEDETDRFVYTSSGNISIPVDLSENIVLGHSQFLPVVFDLTNNTAWSPSIGYSSFPANVLDVYFYGLRSSIIKTDENKFYEFNSTDWNTISQHDQEVLDYAFIDFDFYIGSTRDNGLSFLVSGSDLDGDGAPDTMEDYFGSSRRDSDTDDDGISDYLEIAFGTNPIVDDATGDLDNDQLTNEDEILETSDPRNPDSDYGGANDGWEVQYAFDVHDPSDDLLDNDDDGVNNADESKWGSNPYLVDTDSDSLPDGWEIKYSLDPTDPSNADEDIDGDGKSALEEYLEGTDPLYKDPTPVFEGLGLWILIIIGIAIPPSIIIYKKIYAE